MFKKYLFLLVLFVFPFNSFAGKMILEEYPVMYFPNKEGVKLEVIEDIILDAVDRSSYPDHIWTVDSEKPGEIIARLDVRHHTLRMSIKYNKHMINLQYYDSTRLSFSENAAGIRRIHDKYKPWSEFLLKKIKYVAKRTTKMEFVDESPVKKVVKSAPGESVKSIKLHFYVYGDTNNRGQASGIYSDREMTDAMTRVINKYLKKIKPENVKINRLSWNETYNDQLINEKKSFYLTQCSNNADVVMSGYLEDYVGGSNGDRDFKLKLYTCRTEDLISKTYNTIDSYDEEFAYHFEIIKNIKQFVRQVNPFQK